MTYQTARTADNGLATRLEVPIAQVAETEKPLLGSLADSTGMQTLRKAGGVLKFGLNEIALPKALSMTSKQAGEWLLQKVDVFKNYLNGLNVSLREKAAMAINLRNDLVAAARNAIHDTGVTKWLNEQSPLWIMEEIIAKLQKTLSGDALHKKIVELATKIDDFIIAGKEYLGLGKECKYIQCFPKGTLIHTNKGLVPIENIKKGDMVLSLPENGEGEQTYKKVLKTFKSKDKRQIYRINCGGIDVNGNEYYPQIFATQEHPFYVFRDDEWSWVNLEDLQCGDKFKTYNNINIYVVEILEIYEVLNSTNFAWCYTYDIGNPEIFVDFAKGQQIYSIDECFNGSGSSIPYENAIFIGDDRLIGGYEVSPDNMTGDFFHDYVYNFSVEENHTYFVGNVGILAHNDCDPSKCSPYAA